MVKEFIKEMFDIDKSILAIMVRGFKVCFVISICSILILLFYILNPISYIIYDSGVILFKSSLILSVFLFICAIFTNRIKKEL